MSKIISIGTAVPQFGASQNAILDFMHHAYDDYTANRKLNFLFSNSGISKRYSVVSDFDMTTTEQTLFGDAFPAPDVEKRLAVYKYLSVPLAIEAIRNALQNMGNIDITHLITVTCTGLHSPGIDSEIMVRLGLPPDIFHLPVNFQGCNAAFPALKVADMITKADVNAKILIVCVELCTLHFQPSNSNDNLLSNTIFGDGAAAAIITSDTYAVGNHLGGLTLDSFYSLLLPEGKDLMGWNITPENFQMILDSDVPGFLGDRMDDVFPLVMENLSVSRDEIAYWAIHPGGKKILDVLKKKLAMKESDLWHSYKVLNEYGNMSSPTIFFVLNEIASGVHQPGEKIFCMSFGPGINIDTALMTYVE